MSSTPKGSDIELESLPEVLKSGRAFEPLHHLTTATGKNHASINAEAEAVNSPESPSTPEASPEVDSAAVKKQARRLNVQFAALCFCLTLSGWNDGTIGPLLPRIREVYQIGFTTASLVFVVACVGFCAGALANVYLTGKVAFGKLLVFGCGLQVIAYSIQASAPPLPLFLFAFVFSGMGISIQVSQSTGYVAALESHTRMGIFEACYGFGAFCAPLVATQFSTAKRWSFHFLVSLGLALATMAVSTLVFKFQHQDDCLVQIGRDPGEKNENTQSSMRQLLSLKTVHALAAFAFIYTGTEVTVGGWTVTYIIENRDGGPNAGYISSGFFGGLTLGRVLLLWVNKKIGERKVIFLYCLLAIVFELLVWLVPSLIGGAVAVSIVGLLLGPFFPIAMNHAAKVLPRWLLTASIGWISGLAWAGSAVLPFLSGAFAGRWGSASLQPFVVAMLGTLAVLWAIVPNHTRLD